MYASSDRVDFARKLLLPLFKELENSRKPVQLPKATRWQRGMELVLEQLSDEAGTTTSN